MCLPIRDGLSMYAAMHSGIAGRCLQFQRCRGDDCALAVAGSRGARDAMGCHIDPDVKWKLTGLRGALFPGSKEDNDGNGGLIRDRYDVLRQQFAGMVQAWVAKKLVNVTFYEVF